jgi:arylsulfatase A-like enzyme
MMNVNKTTVSYLLIINGSLTLVTSCTEKETPPPPNIVWLVSEDNSPYIGVYGDTLAQTPNIDMLAQTGIVYNHAFANAPVCAPARNTIITGMYANSLGNHQMRSYYKTPDFVKYFPEYLREAGYYTSNNRKMDYNTAAIDSLAMQAWNESSNSASYKNRVPGQPFFHVQNYTTTHESSLFDSIPDDELNFNPEEMVVYPYHPNTPDFRHDYAQYYHRMKQLDDQIGEFLDDLKQQGLYDSTIVFYYGDHGGVLPRGKRYLFESGTRVPMIVHVPEMYQHLLPETPGFHSDRIVSFVDLAPTILNMVGVEIPGYMQGQPFLGEDVPESPDYAFMFRGRMDEKYDLMHAARNSRYRYIRNYYPERIYGQYLSYLWRSRAIREWERLYKEGKLNEIQSAYWETKPYEELYDIVNDPHNINNLADDSDYSDVLVELRSATNKWIEEVMPVDVIPEPMMQRINDESTLYDYLKDGSFPLMKVHEVARMSARGAADDFETLYAYTKDANPAIAFWAIKSMSNFGDQLRSAGLMDEFRSNLQSPQLFIQNITANVLIDLNEGQDFKWLVLNGMNSELEFDRLEALQLYSRLPHDGEIDALIRELFPERRKDSWGYDQRIATNLMEEDV